jgi:hypothetical protein
MTTRRPPVHAGRLLKMLLPRHDHDALLGDLYEEYQRRRTVTWYRLQILAAIVVGSCKDARVHWVLALRAIGVGAASFLVYFYVVGILVLNNMNHVIRAPGFAGAFVMVWLFFLGGFGVSGWAIVRCHRAYGITLAMPFAALMGVLGLSDVARSALTLHSWTPQEAFTLFGLVVKSFAIPGSIVLGGYVAARRVGTA